MNFNFSFSSNFSNHKKAGKKLTPQEEYWLNRILRDHSGQIFVMVVCFFLFILGTVLFAVVNKDKMNGGSEFSVIQINP